ncbi:MAG TPA: hypothetical protein VIF15_11635 [Polyangiaceae bacterium]
MASATHGSDVSERSSGAPDARSVPTLELLARSDVDALGGWYARGTVPRLADLDGSPRGRMLTLVGPLGRPPAFDPLRRFARSRVFPWAGKSFSSSSDERGRGINRVRVLGDLFAFETHVAPSAVDARPCLFLDYDLPDNPWFIRRIHDELRQISPGLFLGPAMWKTKRAPRLVLYFAIAT